MQYEMNSDFQRMSRLKLSMYHIVRVLTDGPDTNVVHKYSY